MTKYLHDYPEHDTLWRHDDILDNDLEKLEHEKNFEEAEVYNSILDDEPAYHSLMNFPEDEEETLYANTYESFEDEDVFEDRDSYKDADRDNAYYFI